MQRSLSGLTDQLAGAVHRFRHHLVGEAVRGGWLGRLHHDRRTTAGEQLAAQILSFRGALRRRKASGGEQALAGQLPYALLFGLIPGSQAAHVRFAHFWIQTCAQVPGLRPAELKRPDRDDVDFTRDEWRGMSLGLAAAWASGL